MERVRNISELTKEYLIEKLNDYNGIVNQFEVEIDYGSVNGGSGRNAIHKYFYVNCGYDKFSDGGKFSTYYEFIKYLNMSIFYPIQEELKKQNIFFSWKEKSVENGIDYTWYSIRYTPILLITKIVKITPCAEFTKLQKWLKDKANFELTAFDLFSCSICKKRSSVSTSNFSYYCINSRKINSYLETIKKNYKSGYKVSAYKFVEDGFDGGYDQHRCEYEQYGARYGGLSITFSTPTGRKQHSISLQY